MAGLIIAAVGVAFLSVCWYASGVLMAPKPREKDTWLDYLMFCIIVVLWVAACLWASA